MSERIFIVEDGTLTKFETDDYADEVTIPFGRPVLIRGKRGSEAERYTKDNHWCYNEHITEFREIETDAGKEERSGQ